MDVGVLEIVDENGDPIVYVTATEAPAHFGEWAKVTTVMVNKWHSNREITGYRIGREVYFRLAELQDVECVKRNTPQSHRGTA